MAMTREDFNFVLQRIAPPCLQCSNERQKMVDLCHRLKRVLALLADRQINEAIETLEHAVDQALSVSASKEPSREERE